MEPVTSKDRISETQVIADYQALADEINQQHPNKDIGYAFLSKNYESGEIYLEFKRLSEDKDRTAQFLHDLTTAVNQATGNDKEQGGSEL